MLEPPNQITVAISLNFELNIHSQSNPCHSTPQILLIKKCFGFEEFEKIQYLFFT